ncbi:MAG: penicillin-binding protein 2 [Candidatus Tectomicrobia bacterium]|uniref:Penicillin-binding protein 2 n=1 Tax=Tectimicrobiota bacterium TaxID=2528274 RepID=A0A932CQC8_UNCTE|nr:penicillin-binding protein 2 [Candidatus Tectomicrobia bacterium]
MADWKAFYATGIAGLKARLFLLRGGIFLLFVLLLLRLWHLQVINGGEFRKMAENNRVRAITVQGPRGILYDRHKRVIASSRPAFNLTVVPDDLQDLDAILRLFKGHIDLDLEEVKKKVKSAYLYASLVLKRDISRQELAFIEEHKIYLPGINLQIQPLRYYRYNDLASHILGYLGEISDRQLKAQSDGEYRMGDMIGQYGLEKELEPFLKGMRADRLLEVDALGRELKLLRPEQFVPGRSMVLTLDLDIQQAAEELLAATGKAGAVVVLNPSTGEVLAMASKPSFDPNLFPSGVPRKAWSGLIRDKKHPLQNRAVQGIYPPGSVFKIIMATAGLELGLIRPDTAVYCPGSFYFGGRSFRCWRKRGHGTVSLHRALVESCDVYFYQLGRRLGIDNIAKYSHLYGFGERSGVGLDHEKTGTVPSTAWKRKRFRQPWYPGETISVAIGQGYNQMTPIQMAVMMSVVANGGKVYRPHLVKRVEAPDGRVVKEAKPDLRWKLPVKPENLELIQKALRGVVHEPGGTASKARSTQPGVEVAGKTGTAQTIGGEKYGMKGIETEDHAWFVAYAPFKDPQMAMTVLVEHGGHGGSAAAPIAGAIIERYFALHPLPGMPRPAEAKPAPVPGQPRAGMGPGQGVSPEAAKPRAGGEKPHLPPKTVKAQKPAQDKKVVKSPAKPSVAKPFAGMSQDPKNKKKGVGPSHPSPKTGKAPGLRKSPPVSQGREGSPRGEVPPRVIEEREVGPEEGD